MLPKPNRLPAPQIRSVMHVGKRINMPNLQYVYKRNNLPISRFAMIVSTKIDKRATRRNRIKRLLYQAVFTLLPRIATGIDGVFIAKNTSLATDIGTTTAMVEQLLKQNETARS